MRERRPVKLGTRIEWWIGAGKADKFNIEQERTMLCTVLQVNMMSQTKHVPCNSSAQTGRLDPLRRPRKAGERNGCGQRRAVIGQFFPSISADPGYHARRRLASGPMPGNPAGKVCRVCMAGGGNCERLAASGGNIVDCGADILRLPLLNS